jgi:hypothetical protein
MHSRTKKRTRESALRLPNIIVLGIWNLEIFFDIYFRNLIILLKFSLDAKDDPQKEFREFLMK